jgi:hypothetical protein
MLNMPPLRFALLVLHYACCLRNYAHMLVISCIARALTGRGAKLFVIEALSHSMLSSCALRYFVSRHTPRRVRSLQKFGAA